MIPAKKIISLANLILSLQTKVEQIQRDISDAETEMYALMERAKLPKPVLKLKPLAKAVPKTAPKHKPKFKAVKKGQRDAILLPLFAKGPLTTQQIKTLVQKTPISTYSAMEWVMSRRKKGVLTMPAPATYQLAEVQPPSPDDLVMAALRNAPNGLSRDMVATATKLPTMLVGKLLDAAHEQGSVYCPQPGLFKIK